MRLSLPSLTAAVGVTAAVPAAAAPAQGAGTILGGTAKGFSPGPRDLLVERNAKGKFSATQRYTSDLGTTVEAVPVQVSGKLRAKRSSGTLSTHRAARKARCRSQGHRDRPGRRRHEL